MEKLYHNYNCFQSLRKILYISQREMYRDESEELFELFGLFNNAPDEIGEHERLRCELIEVVNPEQFKTYQEMKSYIESFPDYPSDDYFVITNISPSWTAKMVSDHFDFGIFETKDGYFSGIWICSDGGNVRKVYDKYKTRRVYH